MKKHNRNNDNSNTDIEYWEKFLPESAADVSNYNPIFSLLSSALYLYSAKEYKTVFEMGLSGKVTKANKIELLNKVKNYVKNKGMHLYLSVPNAFAGVIAENTNYADEDGYEKFTFGDKDTVINIMIATETGRGAYGSGSSMEVIGFEEEKSLKIYNSFKDLFENEYSGEDGGVYMLESTQNGINVSLLGKAGAIHIKENYSKTVQKQYQYIKKEISKEEPNGRLFILSGQPGVGKTYLVRNLVGEIKNCIFLIIPSNQIGLLGDLSILPALRKLNTKEGKPIVLILEDADAALMPRSINDNMSIVSDILNYTDGILGKIIDIRILATTNAKKMSIEKALMRSGRLGGKVEVGKLTSSQADIALANILEKETVEKVFENDISLADVYSFAKDRSFPEENDAEGDSDYGDEAMGFK